MFWGVILESGKRYSQKVLDSYHLSMACLEPLKGDTKPPANKYVMVMLEHKRSEYALCILEYGRVMQCNLDVVFDCGEVVTFYLNGEGTVHLTGYAIADEDRNETGIKSKTLSATVEEDEEDEADEDWTPSKEMEISSGGSDESHESEEEDSEASSEADDVTRSLDMEFGMNQHSEDGGSTQKKKVSIQGNKSRKRKASDVSPAQNGDVDGEDMKPKKQTKVEINHTSADDSDDDNLSGNESDDEGEIIGDDDDNDSGADHSSDGAEEEKEEISSAGRTPMPKKKVNPSTSLGGSPELLPAAQKKSSQKKQKANTPNVSSASKGTVPVTPKNARKLTGNVLVEDLRLGSGPPAKKGKFVFIYYMGRLTNGKVFESHEPPKKAFSFRLGRGEVIKGLDIGLEGLKVGGKRKITIPPNMGYGNQKIENLPPNSTLIFTVELKSVR